jgi:hypothetical protein
VVKGHAVVRDNREGRREKVLGAMDGALRFSLGRSLRRATMLTALLLLAHCAQRAESIVPRPSCLNRQEGLRVATENVKYLEQQLASVRRALALADRERAIATQRERSACRPENSTEASGAGGHLQRTLRNPFPTCSSVVQAASISVRHCADRER